MNKTLRQCEPEIPPLNLDKSFSRFDGKFHGHTDSHTHRPNDGCLVLNSHFECEPVYTRLCTQRRLNDVSLLCVVFCVLLRANNFAVDKMDRDTHPDSHTLNGPLDENSFVCSAFKQTAQQGFGMLGT